MEALPKGNFDPTKLTGPYALLGAFLLVVQFLLGFWLFQAENSTERIIVGFLMAAIFAGFFFVIIKVGLEKQEDHAISPTGLGPVNPASEEITAEQIESPEPEKLVAPDKSYIIDAPPEDWAIRELSQEEWVLENLGIQGSPPPQQHAASESLAPKILVFETKTKNSVIPIPGKTVVDGIKIPTALETIFITQIVIMPVNRIQGPFFVERPFIHNFFYLLSLVFSSHVMTLYKQSSRIIPNTKRRQLSAEFRQTIQHCLLNGKEVDELDYNLLIIGIEGDWQDYVILAKYPSLPGMDSSRLKEKTQTIQTLVSSFRPVRAANNQNQLRELKEAAEALQKEHLSEIGNQRFYEELTVLLLRMTVLDLENPDHRLQAMKLLQPFKALSDVVNIQDEDILALWDALREAEQGNALKFIDRLTGLTEAAKVDVAKP